MIATLVRRLAALLPTLLGVSICVFAMTHLIPGDPARLIAGIEARPEDVENVRKALGLDRPILEQYAGFLGRALTGDFGTSLRSGRPVIEEISSRYGNTLVLGLAAICVAVLFGIVTGVLSAVFRGSLIDQGSLVISLVGVSMPTFFLGLLLMLVFSVHLGLLPLTGLESWRHLVLPSITLGLPSAAIISRVMRSSLIEVLGQDYIRTARAKGLTEPVVINRHALRNALIPVVTVVGLQLGYLLGGAVVTETVFAYPGLGRLIVQAISARDYPLLQASILLLALTFVLVNLVTDLVCSLLDPRISQP